jgi:hypothetical protein
MRFTITKPTNSKGDALNRIDRTSNGTSVSAARYARLALSGLERISRRKILMCFLAMSLTMGARIALLPRVPIPQPVVADEFSYLLSSETFASGRVTNPTHPMWVHFETFHELMRPTYMGKYPPGQALLLAIGWKLFGHPWYGVWISFGLFCASLCWMLQNWVPPAFAVLGTMITICKITILSYWMDSYWGGSVAAIGGCLLLGCLPRLVRQVKSKDIAIATIGLVLLANTRPFEGMIMSSLTLVALLVWRIRERRGLSQLLSVYCLAPFLLIAGAAALVDGYYDYRITGSSLRMPYTVYFRDYSIAQPWIFLPERKPPVDQHKDLSRSFEAENAAFVEIKLNPFKGLGELRRVFNFYCSVLWLFPLLIGLLLSRGIRQWIIAGICSGVWLTLFIETFKSPHYVAASTGLLPLLAVYGLRYLRISNRSYGSLLLLLFVVLMCAEGIAEARSHDHGTPWETGRPSPQLFATEQAKMSGGKHLIIVRHGADYVDRANETVFNHADIDASQIVWARDMGSKANQELIDYYHGSRKVWLYQPDIGPDKLCPYSQAMN